MIISPPLNSAVLYHPELKWHTIETEHFYIHFYEGEDEYVQLIANYAEEAHTRLTAKYNWTPSGKTHIVVTETEDFANGMATVFPYNTIYIYLIPPEIDSQIGFYDDWLYLLIVHEYTHIIQLDQARGPAGFLRYIFGRTPFTLIPPFTTFPNALMPEWLIEGLATYEESEATDGGRVKSSLMETMVRSAIKEDKFPDIGMGSGDVLSWPWHSFPYFYGGRFYKFLSDNFGEESLSAFQTRYSSQIFPFMLDETSSRVTGYPLKWLWQMWEKEEKKRVKMANWTEQSLTKITKSGYLTRGIRVSPDGRYLLYTKVNPREYPSAYIYDITKGEEQKLFDRNYGIYYAWSPDSKGVYFTQAEVYDTYYTYNDLYYFSIEDRKIKKITEKLRITEFDLSRDGKKGVGIKVENGRRNIILLDLETGKTEMLTNYDFEEGAYNPRFSPYGDKIVFTHHGIYDFYEIAYIDLKSKSIVTLPLKPAFNIFPLWDKEQKGIYYSSDIEGTQELFYYSLMDNKVFRAKMRAPVYEFDFSEDGRIFFCSYSANGFDIYTLEKIEWEEYESEVEGRSISEKEHIAVNLSEETSYSGIKYIYPRFWLPIIYYTPSAGWYFTALTQNSDPLMKHSYVLSAWYYAKYGFAGINANYQNDLLRPSIGINYDYTPLLFTDIESGESFWWRRNGVRIYIEQVFRKFRYYFSTGGHYVFERYSGIEIPSHYNSAGAGVTLLFNSAQKYGLTPGKQDGFLAGMGFRRYDKELGSDIEYYKFTSDLRWYLTLSENNVLSFRLASGVIWGGLSEEVFSVGGLLPGMEDRIFGLNYSDLSLRGYPANIRFGDKAFTGTIEFRLPVVVLDRGFGTFPLFFQKIHSSIFYETGDAWMGEKLKVKLLDAGGVEVKFDTTIIYGYNITFTIGIAKGFDRYGILQFYFSLGSSF